MAEKSATFCFLIPAQTGNRISNMCVHNDKLAVINVISHDLTFALSTHDSLHQPLKEANLLPETLLLRGLWPPL